MTPRADNLRRAFVIAMLLITIVSPSKALCEEGDSLSGYVRGFLRYTPAQNSFIPERTELETRIRLKYMTGISSRLRLEAAYELAPVWMDSPAPFAALNTQGRGYRVGDPSHILYPSDPAANDETVIWQNIDRAFITFEHKSFDLYMGRQPVAFGSARVVNPTDVLVPYPFDTLAKEERIGVDAIRLKKPLAAMSEIDAGIVFGDDFRRDLSAAFLRTRVYAVGSDITFTLMRFKKNNLVGLDITGAIGGAGTWVEAAHVITKTDGNDYTTLSIGADYAIGDNIYAFVEYHHNGAGTSDRSMYLLNTLQEAYSEGNVYLLARNYLMPGLSWQISPLVTLSFNAMLNMDDNSSRLRLSGEYNISDNVYLGLGGFGGTGGMSTEFGNYPDMAYASASYYF